MDFASILKSMTGLASSGPFGYVIAGVTGLIGLVAIIKKFIKMLKSKDVELGENMKKSSKKVSDEVQKNDNQLKKNRDEVDDFSGRPKR